MRIAARFVARFGVRIALLVRAGWEVVFGVLSALPRVVLSRAVPVPRVVLPRVVLVPVGSLVVLAGSQPVQVGRRTRWRAQRRLVLTSRRR